MYVYRFQAGQLIVRGKFANQAGNPIFHSNAVGGGFQIYLRDMLGPKEVHIP